MWSWTAKECWVFPVFTTTLTKGPAALVFFLLRNPPWCDKGSCLLNVWSWLISYLIVCKCSTVQLGVFLYSSHLFVCFSVKPECLLSHCIIAPMVALDPALPANITLKELPTLSPSLSPAKELLLLSKPFQPSAAASVVVFHSQADGKHARLQ